MEIDFLRYCWPQLHDNKCNNSLQIRNFSSKCAFFANFFISELRRSGEKSEFNFPQNGSKPIHNYIIHRRNQCRSVEFVGTIYHMCCHTNIHIRALRAAHVFNAHDELSMVL